MFGEISNPFNLERILVAYGPLKELLFIAQRKVCCHNLNSEICFCSRLLQIEDHHSIYGGKALTVCYYVLNNFYFRKCILVCNAFEMSLPVLHLPYEL